jgi:pyridoxal phosphate enzyme (YggS family)
VSLEAVRARIAAACERAGRDPSGVKLVAVTKQASIEQARETVAAGCTDLGENRAQQLAERVAAIPEATWHFIGPLQTNKVRYLDAAALIHSLESERQAAALARRDRVFEVLIQVNVADEPTKHGVRPAEIDRLLRALDAYPNVKPRGFMFMAPQVENPEDVRWVFAEGAKLRERYGLGELSMGMTDDFEVAIEEGATIVRVGRAIFERT